MIDYGKVPYFSDCVSTLKDISFDSTRNEYMTESSLPAVNFDEVKKKYANELFLTYKVARSVDAFLSLQNRDHLIEYKNGGTKKQIMREVREKISESLLIFCDLANTHISDTRKNLIFVLVYNDENLQFSQSELDQELESSPSREKISRLISGFASNELIGFDLTRFRGFCFKEVHTYTKEEFENYLQKITEREQHEQDSHKELLHLGAQ